MVSAELDLRDEILLIRLWNRLIEKAHEKLEPDVHDSDASLEKLLNLGFIVKEEGIFLLTRKGIEEGRLCIRRHRLAERLLVDILDVKKEVAHAPGCNLGHVLQSGLEDSVCTLLGHPKTCPHGSPIPEGECCNLVKKSTGKAIFPITELEILKTATVCYLGTHNKSILSKLLAMGILPKTRIKLVQTFPAFVLEVGNSQFAVDKELASHIFVRRSR
jgi:DtxR family Mn-dependent transcriptional regulator